ncbi:TonB-dependent receptor [Hephaestia sp. CMS5P-6]|nr:TonB-dependent receptor [Hephaestia mangrovi]
MAIACSIATPALAAAPQNGASSATDSTAPTQTQTDREDARRTAQSRNQAAAQSTDATAGGTGGDILVVGTRASLRSAISRKKNANTVVDSIVADDIASFPDKNVGDALARITGVQLSRDFGEGTQISIRGVEPDLNRIEVNGVSMLGGNTDGSRSGDFRDLAAELVKSIDVYKGYAVDITEGGIGGTVRVETRRPLELKAPIVSLVASEQYLELTKSWKPRGTLVVGTPHLFGSSRLGVLANITYDNVDTRQDYISNTNWKQLADFDHSDQKTVANPDYANYDTYASCATVSGSSNRLDCERQFFDWAPTVPRYRSWIRHDKRISADLQLQYEVAHNFRAHVEAQLNFRNQELNDNNYSIDLGRYQRFQLDPAIGNLQPQVALDSATVNANHVVTSLTTALNSVNIGTDAAPNYSGADGIIGVQARDFSYDQNSQYYQTGFDWTLGGLNLKGLASHSIATTSGNTNSYAFSTSVAGLTIDRQNALGTPSFVFPGSFDPADPNSYSHFDQVGADGQPLIQSGPTLQYRPTWGRSTENQLKLDADWDTGASFVNRIEYGGQFRWSSFKAYNGGGTRLLDPTTMTYQDSANQNIYTVITDTPPANPAANTVYLTSDQYQQLLSQTTGTIPGAPLFSTLRNAPSDAPSELAIPKFNSDVLGQYYDLSNFNHNLLFQANGLPQIPSYKIDETIADGYLMADYDFHLFGMPVTGNFGVRYAYTKDAGTGTYKRTEIRIKPGSGGGTETVTVGADSASISHSYTDILPAVNANLGITRTLFLRANYAKNLARPKPSDLVPNINCTYDTVDVTDETVCSAGNPDLKPYRADQWEVNLAWYPNRDTMVSIGYYKKYESSFIVPNVTRDNVDLFHDGNTFTVRQSVNGHGAKLDGIEISGQTVFSFLPRPFDGFGVQANFTYARAIETNLTNDATNVALNDYPGLSKYTYNASIFYDKGWLNAKLAYNYRSSWLVVVSDKNNGYNPIYRRGEGYLDGKVTFRFPKLHTNFFVEAQNLTNEYSESYINSDMPVDYYSAGRRFFAGFQVKF